MSTSSLTLTRPETSVGNSQSLSNVSAASISKTRIMQLTKSLYQTDQQAKFLHLQAEVESLLQQLQTLKQQKLTSADEADSDSHDAGLQTSGKR
ncbi:MAG: hypothetical protein KME08_09680 [Aphanothece sp. CMT-3BRIN-NPC111]|jgi:hypothetical protein|nr:hypothetical protein [Aphanothece sp. CMT-3BRIN-NPC111]